MQKSVFETFIKRYSLGGVCEAAHWYSDSVKQTLTVRAHTETKTVILKVILKDWQGVESCELALPSSTKIKSMLGPIGDDVTFTLNKIRDRVVNFTISDNDCEAVCTVAEYDALPETPDLDGDVEADKLPTDFEVEVQMTEEFIAKMMKAVAALNEAKDFVIMNNKKGGLDMVINYEDTNTNRIRLPLTTLPGKDKLEIPLGFSTPVLKSILNVNDTAGNPLLKVSSRGIAIIGFEDPVFKSTYFLFPTRVIE